MNINNEFAFSGIRINKDILECIWANVVGVQALSRCREVCKNWYQVLNEKNLFDRLVLHCHPEASLLNYWGVILQQMLSGKCRKKWISLLNGDAIVFSSNDLCTQFITNLLWNLEQTKEEKKKGVFRHITRLLIHKDYIRLAILEGAVKFLHNKDAKHPPLLLRHSLIRVDYLDHIAKHVAGDTYKPGLKWILKFFSAEEVINAKINYITQFLPELINIGGIDCYREELILYALDPQKRVADVAQELIKQIFVKTVVFPVILDVLYCRERLIL